MASGETATDQPGDISVKEADTLAKLITRGEYSWNRAWEGKAILAGMKTAIAPGVELTILSPKQSNLESLKDQWHEGLLLMGVSFEAVDCPEFEDAFEKALPQLDAETVIQEGQISATMGYDVPNPSTFVEDKSVTNGSSIAFLLECFGIRALLLGDAWPSVIMDEWEKVSSLSTSSVDVLKVSHHGSRHNTSPTLADRISAKTYVFSSDGSKHGHPNIETLLWIADGSTSDVSLVFNYPSRSASHMNQKVAIDKFGFNVTVGTGTEPIKFKVNRKMPNES